MKISTRIGVFEFAAGEVRLAIVKTAGKIPRLVERHTAPVTNETDGEDGRHEALRNAVQTVVGAVKNRPAVYTVCESSAQAVARLLKVPLKGKRRVGAAVQFELEPHLAFPIEELTVDHVIVREIEGQTQVLVVGARRAALEEHLQILADAGITIEGAGLDGAGSAMLWMIQHRPGAGLHAALHVRAEGATLAISHDKRPVYLRHLAAPAARFHERPGVTGREVQNMLRAFLAAWGGEEDIQTLTVSGVDLYEDERELFQAELKPEVGYARLLDGVLPDPANETESAEHLEQAWAPLVGLAASSAGEGFSIDFLRNDKALPVRRGGLMIHAAASVALFLAASVVYLGYCYIDYRDNIAERDRIGEAIWQEFKATFPESEYTQTRPPGDVGGYQSFQRMQEEAEEESARAETLSVEMFAKPTLLDVLAELAQAMPNDHVAIDSIRMSGRKNSEIQIEGEVKNSGKFGEIFAKLQASDVLDVEERPRRVSKGGQERFTITAYR